MTLDPSADPERRTAQWRKACSLLSEENPGPEEWVRCGCTACLRDYLRYTTQISGQEPR